MLDFQFLNENVKKDIYVTSAMENRCVRSLILFFC